MKLQPITEQNYSFKTLKLLYDYHLSDRKEYVSLEKINTNFLGYYHIRYYDPKKREFFIYSFWDNESNVVVYSICYPNTTIEFTPVPLEKFGTYLQSYID